MTKERKLAINMWLWIREHYYEWDKYFWESGDSFGFAEEMKHRFLEEENKGEYPKWKGLCWLCTYVRSPAPSTPEKLFTCGRCPLRACTAKDSAYFVLDTHTYKGDIHVSGEVYYNCCSTILNALGYKENKMAESKEFNLDALQALQELTLGTNYVERWQGTPQVLPYNVSTHAYNCAMLYIQLCFICRKKIHSKLLVALLCHDNMESLTGDLLAPAKNASPESWDIIENRVQAKFRHERNLDDKVLKVFLPVEFDFCRGLSTEDQNLLKIIDVLEFILHAQQEYKAGNKCNRVMDGLKYGGDSLKHKCAKAQQSFGYAPAVNDYILDIVTCVRYYYNRQCSNLALSADYYV